MTIIGVVSDKVITANVHSLCRLRDQLDRRATALAPYRLVAGGVSLTSRFGLRITRGYFSRQLHTGELLLPHVPVGFVS